MSVFSLIFLFLTASAQQLVAPGTTLDDAAAVQLSDEGLNQLGSSLGVLVPSPVPVDTVEESGGITCANYAVTITDMLVDVEVTGARLIPKASGSETRADLDLEIDLRVAINDETNKFGFDYAIEVLCLDNDGSCPGYILPFPVSVRGPVSLEVVPDGAGASVLEATIGNLEVDNGLTGPDIELDCGIDTIEDLLNRVGLSFFDLIIGALDPVLQGLIQDQVADLEQQIADALSAASVDEVIDLQGISLQVRLYPGSATSTADGLQIGLDGFMRADPPSDCVADEPAGSKFTDAEAIPTLGSLPGDAALQLTDDLANQGLYGVWQGGLLCFELGDGAEESLDIGLPLNSSLIGLLGGDELGSLFTDDGPLQIRTDPRLPPEVDYAGANDVVIAVRGLDVNFYAELDGRMARPIGMTIEADAGIDVPFDPSTGIAAVELALGSEEIRAEATMIEIAPAAKDTVEDNFAGLLDTLLEQFLGDALTGLSFGLPSLDGFGITDLALGGSPGGEWLTGDADLGVVTYESAGCDEGCSGGSASGCTTGQAVPWLFALVLPLLRRRR